MSTRLMPHKEKDVETPVGTIFNNTKINYYLQKYGTVCKNAVILEKIWFSLRKHGTVCKNMVLFEKHGTICKSMVLFHKNSVIFEKKYGNVCENMVLFAKTWYCLQKHGTIAKKWHFLQNHGTEICLALGQIVSCSKKKISKDFQGKRFGGFLIFGLVFEFL